MIVEELSKKVMDGYTPSKNDMLELLDVPINRLSCHADRLRRHFCQDNFDVCTIINVKSGNCSEDCKFCAQSAYYDTHITQYPLLSNEKLKKQTLDVYGQGLKRISYVSSGPRLNDDEFKRIAEVITGIKNKHSDIYLCVSLGKLNKLQVQKLKDAGVDRIHNNLETSKTYFASVCSTHTYQDKLDTIKHIDNSHMKICSGGIFGIGESWKDRIDLALQLRRLNVQSIPINILNPIKNTPLENNTVLSNEETCRIIAIYRFINPQAYIRLAGGRLLLEDNGRKAFRSGSNAAILGNMLTTSGPSYESDIKMIKELGYKISENNI
ncbi:biotin synthase BioB [Methanosphaera sp. BMS]|uniref:biotin synthase BioB n=1 Tax=Methanosphaera sp. BMS TaxID=1789762 RepID=UPI000DC1E318|nr:biotin synthase BioB [Methanosphaera sp. BMS]AWX32041.1 biotin synthase [Methanosphaera sp. BMS]